MSDRAARRPPDRQVGRAGESPLRVCFYAPFLWPLWSGGRVPVTGGAEVQQASIARGLAAFGIEATVVSRDFGQPSPTTVHGVRVLSAYRAESGLPVLRFFHPRLSGAWRALGSADADVYYVRGASLEAGVAFEVARMRRAAFVFGAAHEHDAHRSLPDLGNVRDRVWYRRALRGATAIVAQTEVQQRLFREQWGLSSRLVRNLVEMPAEAADPGAGADVLWLATYKAAKRPEWFVELARALPHRRFVMCGVVPMPPMTTRAWDAARAAASELPNLDVRGFVEHDTVESLHRGAALFVHTSPAEGFSNTLLEAWASGVPSICCADPDGVVSRERLGETVESLPGLVHAVESWMAAPDRRREAGARARRYARDHHAPEAVIGAMAEVFRAAASTRPGR